MLNIAKIKLEQENYTCVLTDGESFFTSRERGVKPIVEFIASKRLPKGLFAADKVVGKATAYLYIILEIKSLYAKVISKPALDALTEKGIDVKYELLVDNIINRKGDGICPFETAVLKINDANEAYAAVLDKMIELNIK
jgi:hypothetical protein